jgi:hypothetical protein
MRRVHWSFITMKSCPCRNQQVWTKQQRQRRFVLGNAAFPGFELRGDG